MAIDEEAKKQEVVSSHPYAARGAWACCAATKIAAS
jgi:hypothetical protein